MCSKDNKENQQKLMFIDIPHQKNVSARQWGTSQWREREKKSISVNRNYEKKMFNLYYTLKAQYIMIKVGGLVITLEIHLFFNVDRYELQWVFEIDIHIENYF